MKVGDLTIDAIIRKYEHRQNRLLSDIAGEKEGESTVRAREGAGLSGVSTPEFSNTISRRDISRKLENAEEEHIQRTQKKQDHLRVREEEAVSFSTDRKDLEAVLRQLEETEERLARS